MIVEIATAVTGVSAAAGLVFIVLDRVEKMKQRVPHARVTYKQEHNGLALLQIELRPCEQPCDQLVIEAEGLPITSDICTGEYGEMIPPSKSAHFVKSLPISVDLPSSAFSTGGCSIFVAVKLRANQSDLVVSLANPSASRWARLSMNIAINRKTD